MATVYWEGTADAVAQVDTGSIDTVDGTPANNTFTVTIGGETVSVVGDTDVSTTAGNLVAALNASSNPYFSGITWSNPSSGDITATADNAGEPITATLTETGAGTGTVTDFSNTTASSGPNDWSTAGNWSGGAVPVNSDDVIIKDSKVNILWGLDQSAVDLTSLTIEQSYTGLIGLPRKHFTTNANGSNFTETKVEYRQDYLDIGWTTADIGVMTGPGSANGSQRLKLDNDKAGASTTTIHNTAGQAKEDGLPAVRLMAANASADVYVRSAPGGVGIAVDAPDETSTVGTVSVSDTSSRSQVFTSNGVTMTTYQQNGGNNVVDAAATITTVTVDGGELRTEGTQASTSVNVNGGTFIPNSTGTITTLTQTDGTVDASQSNQARTITTYNPNGGTRIANDSYLTITTLNAPSGHATVTVQT